MTSTSVGPPGDKGSNESHGSDGKGNKTLGENAQNSPADSPSRTDGNTGTGAPEIHRENVANRSGRN